MMIRFDSNTVLHQPFPVAAWSIILILTILMCVAMQGYYPLLILPVLLLVYVTFYNVKLIFFLLYFLTPLSMVISLPGGISMDVPNEPVMLGLFLIFIIWFAGNFNRVDLRIWIHPVSILLAAHYLWMLIATFHAEYSIIAVKFFLAKTWYIAVFYFLAHYLLEREADFRTLFKVFFLALIFTIVVITIRHGWEQGFSFAGVNFVMGPFYINHVAYGAIQAVSLPFLYWLYKTESASILWKRFYLAGLIILGIGIYLSFTRAAIGAVVLAFIFVWILKKGWMKPILVVCLLGISAVLFNFIHQDKYLNLAPDYEKTITHQSFDNLLDATYKLEDISTMERVHRWVAAFHMFSDRPILGFGPGNYYENYKQYTLHQFQTYVSDNKEKSGIHNYYLMILIEQGMPGLLIFVTLIILVLLYMERVYKLLNEVNDKLLLLCAAMSFMAIVILQLMNDLIETDKIGPFFFLSMVILVYLHFKHSMLPMVKLNSNQEEDTKLSKD